MAIHQDLTAKTNDELMNMVLAMQAKLDRAGQRKLSIKVSEKGGVSVYGLGRFPVSLYRSQWERLLSAKDDIVSFIEDNAASLATKD